MSFVLFFWGFVLKGNLEIPRIVCPCPTKPLAKKTEIGTEQEGDFRRGVFANTYASLGCGALSAEHTAGYNALGYSAFCWGVTLDCAEIHPIAKPPFLGSQRGNTKNNPVGPVWGGGGDCSSTALSGRRMCSCPELPFLQISLFFSPPWSGEHQRDRCKSCPRGLVTPSSDNRFWFWTF